MLHWSKKKIVIASIITAAALVCSFLFFIRYVSTGFLNVYTISEYGEAVTIMDRTPSMIGSSTTTYRVQSIKNSRLQFTVKVKVNNYLLWRTPKEVLADTYEDGKDTYEEQLKLDTVIGDIERIGFQGLSADGLYVSFDATHRNEDGASYKRLSLMSDEKIDFRNFRENEMSRFHQLISLIQSSGSDFYRVSVSDPTIPSTIHFDEYALTMSLPLEELYHYLRKNNPTLDNFTVRKWEEQLRKIENERFTFGSEMTEMLDLSFECNALTEDGLCNGILLTVQYEHNGLTSENEHLVDDVTAILQTLDHELMHLELYELVFMDKDEEHKTVRLTNEEREQFESVEQLVEETF
ncbi:hypothetical protein [Alkalihalophilus marmarensis]|uniref:Uncharacterized protein n=1 Tax=Alkalihalophilus marmarensis DSM 21297 TaxID=1188261 RepID=U6SLT5_9BACI|nr:hypothetical protein [Alkalihalophilus marmarensis]ERN51855.1 hypothetical protein A33I_18765 [Alkalihalophilus marmarensis DSM 21297]